MAALGERYKDVLMELVSCPQEDLKFKQGYLRAIDDILETDVSEGDSE